MRREQGILRLDQWAKRRVARLPCRSFNAFVRHLYVYSHRRTRNRESRSNGKALLAPVSRSGLQLMIDMNRAQLETSLAPKIATAQLGERMQQDRGIQSAAERDSETMNLGRQCAHKLRMQH